MTVLTMKSEEARQSWRDILDMVFKGGEVVIQRYTKPLAVMVNYDEWQRMKDSEAERLNRQSAEVRAGDFISGEEVDRVLGT